MTNWKIDYKKHQFNKAAMFTDIHFGKKANSSVHNQDCLDFVEWFCDQVRQDPEIDHIQFLGDWHENRSALNISTLTYAYISAKLLNDLDLPIFFTIGNHDLYHRHSREIHSVIHFGQFNNFIMVEEPTVFDNIGDGVMICPYIFHDEYPSLIKYVDVPFWSGHFEFKGFIVTGQGRQVPVGPDHTDFEGPDYIVSGHFHKRQVGDNVVYMGNPFPMDFGDAGDDERGMMTYDFTTKEMLFTDWEDCPKYRKCVLSDLLDGNIELSDNMRVKCIADVQISYEESTKLKELFVDQHNLREFTLEESVELREAISETESGIDWSTQQLAGVDELVSQMLHEIESKHIDNDKLISIYDKLVTT